MYLFPALSASDKRDYGFISTNLCSIYLRYANRLSAANRERPFIFHDKNDIIDLVGKQVTKIHHYFGDKPMNVAMSLGVDANIIVRGWNIIRSHNNIIGGDSPNHYLDIGYKTKEDMVKMLKLCVGGKEGVVA